MTQYPMTKEAEMLNDEGRRKRSATIRGSDFGIPSSFVIGHSSFPVSRTAHHGPPGTLMVVGLTGWNGLLDKFGSPSNFGGEPIILALGYFGKLLGEGNGLTPFTDGKPPSDTFRKRLEKSNRLFCVGMAGAMTLLMSIGLNVIDPGGAPPRPVATGFWGRAGPAMATQTMIPAQRPKRMVPSNPPLGKSQFEQTACEGGENNVRRRGVKRKLGGFRRRLRCH